MPPCDMPLYFKRVARVEVSILVLVDAALRLLHPFKFPVCASPVSILVLVDAALRQFRIAEPPEQIGFQSLF